MFFVEFLWRAVEWVEIIALRFTGVGIQRSATQRWLTKLLLS